MTSSVALNLNAGGKTTSTDNTLSHRVGPEGEGRAAAGTDEVGGQGTATLSTRKHEGAVAVCAVLQLRVVVGDDVLPTRLAETAAQHVESLREIALPVHGWGDGTGDPREDPIRGASQVLALPPCREVGVPVIRVRFPPEPGIDCGSAAKDAARHLVDIGARNTCRVSPDLVAQARYIKTGQVGAL